MRFVCKCTALASKQIASPTARLPESLSERSRLTWQLRSKAHFRKLVPSLRTEASSIPGTVSACTIPPGLRNRGWSESNEELKALAALEEQLKAAQIQPIPDRQTQIWFLRDRSLDVAEAVEKLTAMTRWRNACAPQSLTEQAVAAEAATGKVLLHTHLDNFDRPVVLVRAARHKKGEWPLQDSQRLCAFTIESAVKQLPEGGESILGIFDMQGFGPSNADLDFFYFLIDVFFRYYPKRLSQLLLVDAPWVFKPLWTAVKPAMGKYAELASFVTKDDLCPRYFSPDTLPDAFKL